MEVNVKSTASHEELVKQFCDMAALVSAKVVVHNSFIEAVPYLVQVAKEKAPCEILSEEEGTEKGPLSPNDVPTRLSPIVAAPNIGEEEYKALESACNENNITCIKSGLRSYLAGIDIGIAHASHGIANSATCFVDTNSEDVRLATMMCEISVLTLRKSTIVANLLAIADSLRSHIASTETSYTTFITGPSRTADIERVGAVGVHGPLELHIILLED